MARAQVGCSPRIAVKLLGWFDDLLSVGAGPEAAWREYVFEYSSAAHLHWLLVPIAECLQLAQRGMQINPKSYTEAYNVRNNRTNRINPNV